MRFKQARNDAGTRERVERAQLALAKARFDPLERERDVAEQRALVADAGDELARKIIRILRRHLDNRARNVDGAHSLSSPSSKRRCFTLRPCRRTSLSASMPILMCASTKLAVITRSLCSVLTPSGIIG